ncbi:hypothetical protein C0J52_19630 [Blattella germanica]|nr:hypothetical protein C0J52_19630 [Blattella germanica]
MAQRQLLTPTAIVCVFPIFGSKVLQINQICIFSSDYTEYFPVVFQTPLEYCFEKGLTEECFRENCDQPAFIKCAHCERRLCLDHAVIADLHILCL